MICARLSGDTDVAAGERRRYAAEPIREQPALIIRVAKSNVASLRIIVKKSSLRFGFTAVVRLVVSQFLLRGAYDSFLT